MKGSRPSPNLFYFLTEKEHQLGGGLKKSNDGAQAGWGIGQIPWEKVIIKVVKREGENKSESFSVNQGSESLTTRRKRRSSMWGEREAVKRGSHWEKRKENE